MIDDQLDYQIWENNMRIIVDTNIQIWFSNRMTLDLILYFVFLFITKTFKFAYMIIRLQQPTNRLKTGTLLNTGICG